MISDEIVDEVVDDGRVLGGTEEMTSAVLVAKGLWGATGPDLMNSSKPGCVHGCMAVCGCS
jgi:hypothetical protein